MLEINWEHIINSIAPLDGRESNGEGPLDAVEVPSPPDFSDPEQLAAYLAYEETRTVEIRTGSLEAPPTFKAMRAAPEGAVWNETKGCYDSYKYVEKEVDEPIPEDEMRRMFNNVLWYQDNKIKALHQLSNTSE